MKMLSLTKILIYFHLAGTETNFFLIYLKICYFIGYCTLK